MEQSTSLFSQGNKPTPVTYSRNMPQDTGFALRTLRQLEDLPWYKGSNATIHDQVAAVSVLMQYWARTSISRPYAAKVASKLLEDIGIVFNREASYEDIEPFATNLISREVMADYSKFTLLTDPSEDLAKDLLHRFSVRLDTV